MKDFIFKLFYKQIMKCIPENYIKEVVHTKKVAYAVFTSEQVCSRVRISPREMEEEYNPQSRMFGRVLEEAKSLVEKEILDRSREFIVIEQKRDRYSPDIIVEGVLVVGRKTKLEGVGL